MNGFVVQMEFNSVSQKMSLYAAIAAYSDIFRETEFKDCNCKQNSDEKKRVISLLRGNLDNYSEKIKMAWLFK